MSKTIGVLALVTATTVLSFVSVVARRTRISQRRLAAMTNEPSRAVFAR